MSRVAGSAASRSAERVEPRPERPQVERRRRGSRTGSRARRRRRRAGARTPRSPRAPRRPPPSRRRGRPARGVEDVRGPERVHPDGLEPRATRPPRPPRAAGRRRPSRTCRRRRRRRAGRVPRRAASVTAARSRIGCRRPRPAAIPARRRSSPTDSTVTTRTPASTAAASSSSRLPGPVTTIRSGAMPARMACRSSPAEADVGAEAEAGEVAQDREVRVRLDRVGEVERRRQDGASAATWRTRRRGRTRRTGCRSAGELRGVHAAQPAGAMDLVARGWRPRRTTGSDGRTGGGPGS